MVRCGLLKLRIKSLLDINWAKYECSTHTQPELKHLYTYHLHVWHCLLCVSVGYSLLMGKATPSDILFSDPLPASILFMILAHYFHCTRAVVNGTLLTQTRCASAAVEDKNRVV